MKKETKKKHEGLAKMKGREKFFWKKVWQQKRRRVTMRRVDKDRGNITYKGVET